MRPPILKDLVLLGAGHSHAIALKQFGMKPLPGVRLTVIAADVHTPYSGMLPGYVAGFYDYDECHIDARPLSEFAGARLFASQATGLDLDRQLVFCHNRPPVPFDVLSINIGSTPAAPAIPGADAFAIPAKPVRQFLQRWQALLAQVRETPQRSLTLAVVGGGAGGVELTLAMRSRLVEMLRVAGQSEDVLKLHLFHRGPELMPSHPAWVRRRFTQLLRDRGVEVHLSDPVTEVGDGWVRSHSGLVTCDRTFWVTQANAPAWLREAGLKTDDRGFVLANDALQSLSHANVFAAGDIVTMANHPRPKAGVFAVRQGQPLFENLQRALRGESLKPFQPQKQFLTLIGTGDRSAVAARGRWAWQSRLMWRWKDRIDRQFMARFEHLTPMPMSDAAVPTEDEREPSMRCRGCGSKVGSTALTRALQQARTVSNAPEANPAIAIGLDAPDDAAVLDIPGDRLLVQTVDYFPAIVDDPFIGGKIAIEHALNDIWAMGATPHSVLALASVPPETPTKTEHTLGHILAGAMQALAPDAVPIVGGHTLTGDELAIGFVCNGWVERDRLWRKSGLQPGHVLIATKALGTGVLFAANAQLKAKGRWIEAAIQSMTRSNRAAATCLHAHGATACTDISGFGLVGHAAEMARASQVHVEIDLDGLVMLDGAVDLSQSGIASSLYPQNWQDGQSVTEGDRANSHPRLPLAFDPQTSGGLLAGVPSDRAEACLAELKAKGYPHSHVVGRVLPSRPGESALITLNAR